MMELGRTFLLPEPKLTFRHDQHEVDPRIGLSLYGPWDAGHDGPARLSYGVIGTARGIERFEQFAEALDGAITNDPPAGFSRADLAAERQRLKQQRLWPAFPGFSTAFSTHWISRPTFRRTVNVTEVEQLNRQRDEHRRVHGLVDLYLEPIRIAQERDNPPHVLVCVVPDEVWLNCRPLSRVQDGEGQRLSAKQQAARRKTADLFGDYDPEEYDYSTDFRRQLKARALCRRIPIQLIRESTLTLPPEESERALTCLSDRAWNLATALYYKAGGKPWRLASARPGVCYIGLAFKKERPGERDARQAACAAQMFLDTGDGIVFRGELGPWYAPREHQFRLGKSQARTLLEGVLEVYREQDGRPLREIFLHSHSGIAPEDFEGYAEACPAGAEIAGVRIRRADRSARLYRAGRYPVVRGTTWALDERSAFLWTNGFKPHLLTYDGWMVPAPVRIDVQHGNAPIERVASDVLGLTKLNYNACRSGDAMPVTVKFSSRVGEILVSNPTVTERQPNSKFYI